MNHNLNIAALPLDIALGQSEANLRQAAEMMALMPAGTDLAVLPELFNTGFVADREQLEAMAQPFGGDAMAVVKALSAQHHCAIAGSMLCRDSDSIVNRAFIVEPNGDSTYYDKRHLFCLSQESKVLKPGTKLPAVARFRGWNIALAVCYDLRFPVWCRNAGTKYDLLLFPSNWPERRSFAFTHLLQARAIENQAYVVGANRSGTDEFGCYDNQTYIYDYRGQSIGTEADGVVTATLSHSQLEKYRQSFPFQLDADSFNL